MTQTSAAQVREQIRRGEITGNTSGLAPGFVQCNLVVLPADYANDFLRFCQRNPKPCPLIAMADKPGDFAVTDAGEGIDIRTDFPAYEVFEHGRHQQQITDLTALWRQDWVSFLLGCSFSFEEALLDNQLEVRNITEGVNVPMYKTNLPCQSAGPFHGNMVVSMRPMKAADAIRAIQICSRFPQVHGAPVHLGDPTLIGINDLQQPDYGDAVTIGDDELPVFWACGVTPQLAIQNAKPPVCITHSPGCMLITDLRNSQLSML
ncbi:UPF0317 protein [Saliniradius amylolyticus]|uniref:Putative hydro-lyase HMF8227_02660 n=1 Tax=Saliniradius amylolyticus TaxID=2183582 RepID=A0A2S2E6F6_9ALTE|nr:putative hydro-lyase [Saliniradius amylolyticus]AWL13112.1 UPF0317 protein [Saliniradius amylolyticus]